MTGPQAWFITLEGGEGVGKSTQLPVILETLRDLGHDPLPTREPGGTPVAERVRDLLLDPALPAMGSTCELLLVFAGRAEHLRAVIEPALEGGRTVVCDRFTDATYAYQGAGRELPETSIALLEHLVQGHRRPDLTLLLDAPVEVALARARRRGAADRLERETIEFFNRVRQCYLERAAGEPQRFRVFDATAPEAEVSAEIRRILRALP